MSMIGTIGNFVHVDFEPDFCIKNVALIKPVDLKANFLIQLFNSPLFQEHLNNNLDGGIQKFIALGTLRKLAVPIPPLPEQRAIAEVLSDVDELITALDHLIAKKRAIKKGAMQELLIPKTGWKQLCLGDIASFHKGKGLPKNEITPFGTEPCIHYGELFTKYPESIHGVHSRTNTKIGTFRSHKNDVLMPTSDVTPDGLATASCILQDQVILGGDILVIRAPCDKLNGSFLSYMIRHLREQVMKFVSGTTVYHLYGGNMENFKFSMPGIKQQDAIVEILDDMDAEIAALEAQRDKTHALKKGLMQELLTGRTRLV